MRFTSLFKFSKHPTYHRSFSYFSKANLENVNQDINKIAKGNLITFFSRVLYS